MPDRSQITIFNKGKLKAQFNSPITPRRLIEIYGASADSVRETKKGRAWEIVEGDELTEIKALSW